MTQSIDLVTTNGNIPKPEIVKKTFKKINRKRLKSIKKQFKKSNESLEGFLLEIQIKELLGEENYERLLPSTGGGEVVDQKVQSSSDWNLVLGSEIEVEIKSLTSLGDGIAISPTKDWAIVVPFCVPEDSVRVRIYKNTLTHSLADLLEVIRPGQIRNDDLVKCKYFGKCSGCQFQMISYEDQLKIKKNAIETAFKYLSGLEPVQIPKVDDTLASPLEYAYRNKLTPHFDLPKRHKPSKNQEKVQEKGDNKSAIADVDNGYQFAGKNGLAIGLCEKGRQRLIDIEECSLATEAINDKLISERERVQKTIHNFKRGSTLLLRDSLIPSTQLKQNLESKEELKQTAETDTANTNKINIEEKETDDDENRICVTDHKSLTREKVLNRFFEQNAGSFFQTNVSILKPFLNYIIQDLLPPSAKIINTAQDVPPETLSSSKNDNGSDCREAGESILIDAYCGSGLFSICLADRFSKTIGIEISQDSILYANCNAKLNSISNSSFILGKAEAIFKDLQCYDATKCTMIIDPPRKGCDQEFLSQLMSFRPSKIIYISCNVHSQARDDDVERFIDGIYQVDRIRGVDFFPQTHHCESIVLLSLRK
ncbi:S-adenosyl-L-methionine-dependent methyltransferase [Phakopsora pachyrhizi]|uniref:S-adenosyl-L-methionine-dependent methyltransferase n=1 Tax=Phakopsora pachyrhizi TaxID=170000 RepID=A0AAV0BL55_PHAPC|nr:S-adenosyl-L-methionine-dependent methyltransferase [Phakopsora pachyrhizi]